MTRTSRYSIRKERIGGEVCFTVQDSEGRHVETHDSLADAKASVRQMTTEDSFNELAGDIQDQLAGLDMDEAAVRKLRKVLAYLRK